MADELEATFGHRAAGFGSLRVEMRIGSTTWRTSGFPDRKRATSVLPVKRAVRTAEGIVAGATVDVELCVLVRGHPKRAGEQRKHNLAPAGRPAV